MKLALGGFAVGLGYAMVYYAIGIFQHYSPTSSPGASNTQDLFYSFSYLLGFPNNGKFSSLPFKFTDIGSGMSYSTPQPSGNASNGGSIQPV